jgi:Spy/CpxP family protein refolding chaperone
MTDVSPQTPDTPTGRPTGRPTGCKSRGRRTAFVVAIALAAGLAGAFASNAISKGGGWHHGGHGHGRHGGDMGGPMGFGFMGGRDVDPAKAERRAERMAERFARRIDATGEQQSKLIAIAKSTAKDIIPLRQQAGDMRKEAMKLMSGPQVDRAALEKLRADQIARMDQISKRMTQGIADAAEVLTPEQRQKVAERMEQRREGRRGWFRGHGRDEGRGDGPGEGRGPQGRGGDTTPVEPKKE